MKTCPNCNDTKPLDAFAFERGRYRSMCKSCTNARRNERERIAREGESRTCTECGLTKPMTEFGRRAGTRSGASKHESKCKACVNLAAKKRRSTPYYPEHNGTNPWDWKNYKSQINWIDNTRYVPTDAATKSYVGFSC